MCVECWEEAVSYIYLLVDLKITTFEKTDCLTPLYAGTHGYIDCALTRHVGG